MYLKSYPLNTMNNSIFQLESVRNNYLCLLRQQTKIHLSEIILLEAEVNYTRIYLQNGTKIMIAKTLKAFEEVLANHHFYRIHRAFLINGIHLKSYDSELGEVLLTNNHKAITSRRRKVVFEVQINGSI
jgi:DNA-binding LytR/AlgR family response regulator